MVVLIVILIVAASLLFYFLSAPTKTVTPVKVIASLGASFYPAQVTIVIGINNTVIWTNTDVNTPHSATATDGSFASPTIQGNQTWSYTFTKPGTYQFYCVFHYYKTGTIFVKG